MANKIFIIKNQGKGEVTEVPVENLVEHGGNSSSGGISQETISHYQVQRKVNL